MIPQLAHNHVIDLQTLVDTRLLIQANSGGGKSHCIRRILEQTHGQVQHLVLDLEGEFATLREKFDYVLASPHGGDTVANPRSAALLAHRLLELQASAILDIYDLKHHERITFARLFLEALINAPKALWHPALVIVDEAHVFCPQKGEAESASAVIDLATRGRKRGFCAVLATQRLSKLHKDAAAECNNKLIGRTALDVDVDRAGDELGFPKNDRHVLRSLTPGEFFMFGPALNPRVPVRITVGPVTTTHPKAGARLNFTPPPPTSKIKALLPKLADLPAEAEQKAKTETELRKEITELRRQLTLAQREQKTVEKIVEVATVDPKAASAMATVMKENRALFTALEGLDQIIKSLAKSPLSPPPPQFERVPKRAGTITELPPRYRAPRPTTPSDTSLGKCERAILSVLANQPEGATAGRLTLLTRYRYSGGFKNSLSALRQAGYIEGENTSVMSITDAGRDAVGPVEPLPQGRELAEYWLKHPSFGKCESAILEALLEHPQGLTSERLCEETNYQYSGGFKNALSNLRTAGVLLGKNTEVMRVSEDLL